MPDTNDLFMVIQKETMPCVVLRGPLDNSYVSILLISMSAGVILISLSTHQKLCHDIFLINVEIKYFD